MIFVSNPSILFKKSQVVYGVFFFFFAIPETDCLIYHCVSFPQMCILLVGEIIFWEGRCVCVGGCVGVGAHARTEERDI